MLLPHLSQHPLSFLSLFVLSLTPVPFHLAIAKVTIEVSPAQQYQQFDGLGISEAFQRARLIYGSDGLSIDNTEVVLNALFSNKTGAGLTILRNGIGSGRTPLGAAAAGGSLDWGMSSIAPLPPGSLAAASGSPGGEVIGAGSNAAPASWNGTNATTIPLPTGAGASQGPRNTQGVSNTNTASPILVNTLPISLWNNVPPRYTWDSNDNGQVRLARDALARGLRTIYADAWSAPAWMKSNFRDQDGIKSNGINNNGNDSGGGSLCGVEGVAQCRQGDMRNAYAEYLVKYLGFWEAEGVKVDVLGAFSAPDVNASHASMLSTGGQAASFLKILHAKLRTANLTSIPHLTCCDGSGWEQSREQILGIKNAGAEDLLDIVTSHGYNSPPSSPLPTTHRVWQSEWADLEGPPTLAWWFNHSAGEGLTWAVRIQDAFVHSNVSAFLGWYGAGNASSNSALVTLEKNEVRISKRLWAFAQFSRFIRPGARRIDARILPTPSTPRSSPFEPVYPSSNTITTYDGTISVSAFQNPDSGIAVQVINNSTLDECVQINGVSTRGKILRRWLTNEDHDLSKMSIDTHRAGRGGEECVGDVVGALPAKSMVSFVVDVLKLGIPPAAPGPAPPVAPGPGPGPGLPPGGLWEPPPPLPASLSSLLNPTPLPSPPGSPGNLPPPPLPASLSSLLNPIPLSSASIPPAASTATTEIAGPSSLPLSSTSAAPLNPAALLPGGITTSSSPPAVAVSTIPYPINPSSSSGTDLPLASALPAGPQPAPPSTITISPQVTSVPTLSEGALPVGASTLATMASSLSNLVLRKR